MVVDYEKAWIRLQASIAGKSQHGREGLLREMAELARECQVPGGELSRLLRLYSIEVERSSSIQTGPAGPVSSDADGVRVGIVGSRDIIDQPTEGGHDVGNNGRSAALV